MENLHAGIYRRLKDRAIPVTDKIKLVKFAWKSDRVIIPNKEQVLIDFVCGLLLNRKRNNLTENDVAKIWICFCEILNSRKIFRKSPDTPIIIVKPSICQVINDRLSLEVDKSRSDNTSDVGHVLGCSFAVLVSPTLSYIFSTKLDYMINLLSAVVKLTVKYLATKTPITQTHEELLKKCIEVYRSCQRGYPNQKQVLQLIVEKLLVPSAALRYLHVSVRDSLPEGSDEGHDSGGLDRYRHPNGLAQGSDAGHCPEGLGAYRHPDGLGHCVDGLMNGLEESLFNKDHIVSYDMYLSIICGTGELKSQPPKVIENIFTTISNCLHGKIQLAYITPDILQKSFTDYLPAFFEAFLKNECHGDKTIAHWLFSHICSVIGLKSDTSDLCGPLPEPIVLRVISRMLLQIQKCDVYSVSEDKSAENTQLKYYRHILDVVLKSKLSPEFYHCLLHLFQLNHEILEPNLVNVFQRCWLSVDQLTDDCTVIKNLDELLAEIVSTYSKLRQVGRWLDKLLISVTNSNRVRCLLIPYKFSTSFRNVIHGLPQSTTIDLWKRFVDVLKDECLPELFYDGDMVWVRRLQDITNLFRLYTINMRIADYGITDITSQRVKEVMDIIPTDIIKPLVDVAVEQKKHDLLTSVLSLCHSWGEVYLLLNQYKPDVVQHTQSQTAHMPTLYFVHKYVLEDVWTKLHNKVVKAKDFRSLYLWDLLLTQELRFSLCAQTVENTDRRSHIENILHQILYLPSHLTEEMMAASWDTNSITSENSIIAKWDLIIHLLPLVVSVISVNQSNILSDFVVHVMTKSHQSERIRFKEDTTCHSLLTLTKDFLNSAIIKECESLQVSLVTMVMSEVKNKILPKPKSAKKKKSSPLISQVMLILDMLTDEDVTWTKEINNSQLIYLQKIAEKVNELILYDNQDLLTRILELLTYLQIMSYLPLSHLSATNQIRCVYGLITILKVTFRDFCIKSKSLGSEELPIVGDNGGPREITPIRDTVPICMDLLTLLVESMGQTPVFQLLDLCSYWKWISMMYNELQGTPVLFMEKIDLLVGVTWHSIFKDFQVVMNMSPCIEMIKRELQAYGSETKQNLDEKKYFTKSPILKIFAALLDELEKVLSRGYLKEEVKVICEKYYRDLTDCLNPIVTNIRKSSLSCPAILVKCYARILYIMDVGDNASQKMVKKNFVHMISVCTRWLSKVEMSNTEGIQDLLYFMNSVFKQDKKLSVFYKDDTKLEMWKILTDLLGKMLNFDSNIFAQSPSRDGKTSEVISDRAVCLFQESNNNYTKDFCRTLNHFSSLNKHQKNLMSSETNRKKKAPESKALQQCRSYRQLEKMLIHEGIIESQRSKVIMLQVQEVIGALIAACSEEQFRLVSDSIIENISAQKVLEDAAQLKLYLYLWKQLLQYELSEDKYNILCHAVQSVMIQFQSIIQLIKDLDNDQFLTDIAIQVLDIQVLMLKYGPQLMSPQTAVLSLHSCQDLPLEGSMFIPSFHAVYEVLNALLVHHTNTVLQVIPTLLSCSKRLLMSVIHEGCQDKLSRDPVHTQEVLICAQFVDRLFLLITTYKVEFCKVASYLVADYVTEVQQVTLLPAIKKALVPAVYKLLDICDKYSVAQLHTVLNPGVKEVFKLLYSDYMKYHKYTGKQFLNISLGGTLPLVTIYQDTVYFVLPCTVHSKHCSLSVYISIDDVIKTRKGKALVPAVYKLLDICDKYSVAQLHTVLNPGVKEVFKLLYSDYMKYHKYTGKI